MGLHPRKGQVPHPIMAALISIIVPAFNEEKILAESLRALSFAARQGFAPAGITWELIVCDNNSTDRTGAIAREAGATVVFEAVNQIGRARNAGAAAAAGFWLLFIDADSRPSAALLREASTLISRPDVLLVGATLVLDEAPAVYRLATLFWNAVSRLRGLVAGSFILVRSAAFREVGGFDLRFFAGEELDLARRLRNVIGRRERLRTVIIHRHPLLTSARKIRLYRRAELLRFFLKILRRPRQTLGRREDCAPWYDGRR